MEEPLILPDPFMKLDLEFRDIDAFLEVVKGWDLDFKQLDRGNFHTKLKQIIDPTFQLSEAKFNRQVEQAGSSPPGVWTLALPKNPDPIFWRGKHVKQNEVLIYQPGSEIEGMSYPGFEVNTLSLPIASIDRVSRALGFDNFHKMIGEADRLLVNAAHFHRFRMILKGLTSDLIRDLSLLKNDNFRSQTEENISLELGKLFEGLEDNRKPIPKIRIQSLKRVEEYIASNGDDPISVKELCKVASVSERTLQYAFRERFGVSPKGYLQAYRLSQVHRDLWKANPTLTKVVDVANRWGFWHMGQFAADYKKHFQELPSETLRKTNAV